MRRARQHRYELRICWSPEDRLFVVEIPDLSGCMAHGDTPSDAAANAEDAIAAWIATAREVGREIPEPRPYQALV